jgi:hypothetical protein
MVNLISESTTNGTANLLNARVHIFQNSFPHLLHAPTCQHAFENQKIKIKIPHIICNPSHNMHLDAIMHSQKIYKGCPLTSATPPHAFI